MAVTFVAAGTAANGTTTCSPGIPAGVVAGDLLILGVETANQAVTTPSGWTATIAPTGTGTAASTTATRCTVFHKIASGSDTAPACAVTGGDHVVASVIAMRGVDTTTPIQASASTAKGTTSTTNTAPTVTTTQANQVVVILTANLFDTATAQAGAVTNAALSNITERVDNNAIAGNGGGVAIITATKATAGATGTTTITMANTTLGETVTLALTTKAGDVSATQTAAVTTQTSSLARPTAFAFIQGSGARSGTASTTAYTWGTAPTIGNKLVVVVTGWKSAGFPTSITVTDNASPPNTYTARQNNGIANTANYILDCDVGAVPTVTTVTYSPSSGGNSASFTEFAGLGTYDTGASAAGTAAGGYPVGPTSTLAQADELVITGLGAGTGANPSGIVVPTGFTSLGIEQDSPSYIAMGSAYKVVAATSAVSVSWGVNNTIEATGTIATYKITASGAASISTTQTADPTTQTANVTHGTNTSATQTAEMTTQSVTVTKSGSALWTPALLSQTKDWVSTDAPTNTVASGAITVLDNLAGGTDFTPLTSNSKFQAGGVLNSRQVGLNTGTGLYDSDYVGGTLSLSNNQPSLTLVLLQSNPTSTAVGGTGLSAMAINRGTSNNARALIARNQTTGSVVIGGRRNDADGFDSVDDATNHGTGYSIILAEFDYANAVQRVYVDGVLAATDATFLTAGNTAATNSENHHLASQGGGGVLGNYAEALWIQGLLGTTNRQNLEGYLAWYWGLQANLDVTHPYKSTYPPASTSASVSAAQTAEATTQTATVIHGAASVSATQTAAATTQTATLVNVESVNASQTAVATSQTVTVAHGTASVSASQTAAVTTQTATISLQEAISATQTAQATVQSATLSLQEVISAAQTAAVTTQTATVIHLAGISATQTAAATSQTANLALIGAISATQTAAAATQTATVFHQFAISATQTAAVTTQVATLGLVGVVSATQTAAATSQTATLVELGAISAAQTADPTTQSAALTHADVANLTATQTAAPTTQTVTLVGIESISANQTAAATSQTATLGARASVSANQTAAATTQTATVFHQFAISAAQTAQATTQTATLGNRVAISANQTADAPTQVASITHAGVALVSAAQTAEATTQAASLVNVASISTSQTAAATTQTVTLAHPTAANLSATQTAAPTTQAATIAAREAISAIQTAQATSQAATIAVRGVISAAQTAAAATQVANITHGVAGINANQTAAQTTQTANLAARVAILTAQTAAATTQAATMTVRSGISATQLAAQTTQLAFLARDLVIIANERTYVVRSENRTYTGIHPENRVRTGFNAENRVLGINAQDRAYEVE